MSEQQIQKKPVNPMQSLRENMEGEFAKTVLTYYRNNEDEALAFKTACVDYVRRVPKLLECDRVSLLSALVQSAQFRFMPSGVSGECYIIPYGKEAKFQLGYQGIVTLLYRTDQVASIRANIVYQGEHFDYQEGLDAHLVHKPAFGTNKSKPIGVYTVIEMKNGSKTFKVMDKDSVLQIKNLSKAKNSNESPWNSDKDPELWMWKKTCLLQHAKLLPKSREILEAVEKDYEGEGIARPVLDAEGPAVARAIHQPTHTNNEEATHKDNGEN